MSSEDLEKKHPGFATPKLTSLPIWKEDRKLC